MAKADFIKNHPHFKLALPFKEMIVFESLLRKADIDFYREDNPLLFGGIVTYFLLDDNRYEINTLIKENRLDSGTETITVTDYRGLKKMYKLYALIVAVLIIIFAIFA